jgi:hypothetical protein
MNGMRARRMLELLRHGRTCAFASGSVCSTFVMIYQGQGDFLAVRH